MSATITLTSTIHQTKVIVVTVAAAATHSTLSSFSFPFQPSPILTTQNVATVVPTPTTPQIQPVVTSSTPTFIPSVSHDITDLEHSSSVSGLETNLSLFTIESSSTATFLNSLSFAPTFTSSATTTTLQSTSTRRPINPAFLADRGTIQHINRKQQTTIWSLAVILISSLVAWNLKIICWFMYPFKMFVILLHEFSHALVGLVFGAKIHSVCIDPDHGGISTMSSGKPIFTLTGGYFGSCIIGCTLILVAFDISASKIAYLILSPVWLVVFWFAITLSCRVRIVLAMCLTIGLWFIDHGAPLRFYLLFLGVLNAFYVLFDTIDDLVFRKQNESDASLFCRLFPCITVQAWAAIWTLIAIGFVAMGVMGGIYFFPQGNMEMLDNARRLLPT